MAQQSSPRPLTPEAGTLIVIIWMLWVLGYMCIPKSVSVTLCVRVCCGRGHATEVCCCHSRRAPVPASLPCTVHGHLATPHPHTRATAHMRLRPAPGAWRAGGGRGSCASCVAAWFSLLLAALRLLTWATPDLHTRQPLRRSRAKIAKKRETPRPRAKNINTENT